MNMFKLPMDIQIKIFEFDTTYRDIFSKVLNEFHKVHSFWYIRFHDVDLSKEMSTAKDLTYQQAFHLAYYWNLILEQKSTLHLMIRTIMKLKKVFAIYILEQIQNI